VRREPEVRDEQAQDDHDRGVGYRCDRLHERLPETVINGRHAGGVLLA